MRRIDLLPASGLAGLLHDAGNLAVTRLTAEPAVAAAVLLTAKWTVNLAGLPWVAAAVAAVRHLRATAAMRVAGVAAALSGLAAVVLPWTTGPPVPPWPRSNSLTPSTSR